MGGGQPLGFGSGLLLGGVFAGTIGWRWGFYIAAIIAFVVLGLTFWQLPTSLKPTQQTSWGRIGTQADWIGVLIASASLAMLSYVLAYIGPFPPLFTHQSNHDQIPGKYDLSYKATRQHRPARNQPAPNPYFRPMGPTTGAIRPTGSDPQQPLAQPRLHIHLHQRLPHLGLLQRL